MEVLAVMAMWATTNILCFLIGARVGQKVSKGEKVEMPKSPMELYREQQAKREAERVKDKIDTILHNIDMYDGTDHGQEDVPR